MVPRQLLFFLGLLPCLVLGAVDSTNNDIETAAETHEVLVSADEGLAVGAANVQALMTNETTASQATPWSAVDMTEEMYFGVDIGVPQVLYDQVQGIEQQQVESIAQARTYLQQEIWVNGPNVCSNRVEYCAYYAITGECEKNADFMQTNCAPMCRMCDPNAGHVNPLQMGHFPSPVALQHQDPNCPVDFSTNTWGPGDLDKMFERILSTPEYQNYEPKVLSRPSLTPGDTNETANYIVGSPWMIVFDNFVSEEEADRLVELGAIEGYDRSLDVSNLNSDGSIVPGASPDRTSTNAWCLDACARDPKAVAVANRIAEVTGIPESYAESLQLLRYTEGQFYKVHHDYIESQEFRPTGPRILTFFIYLNDVEPDAGGGTNFPHMDPSNPEFAIQPKKGRAVLWPSVLNEDVSRPDGRTMHQALPVTKGVKYGANAWIHLRDYKNNGLNGCL